jgi:hypothetical protein
MIKASFVLVVCGALIAQDIEYSFNTPIPDKSVILSNVTMHTVNKTTEAETVITGDVIVTSINSDGSQQTVYYFVPYNKVGIIWMITKPGPNKGEKAFYGAMTPGGAVLAADDTKWALFSVRKIQFAVDANGAYIEYCLELEK